MTTEMTTETWYEVELNKTIGGDAWYATGYHADTITALKSIIKANYLDDGCEYRIVEKTLTTRVVTEI